MNVMFLTSHTDAAQEVVSTLEKDGSISAVIMNTIAAAADELREEPHTVIADLVLGNHQLVYHLHTLRDAGARRTFVRFGVDEYQPDIYAGLLSMGIEGMFMGWPSADIIRHEIGRHRLDYSIVHPRFGQITLQDKKALVGGKSIRLTGKEALVIRLLMRAHGETLPRDQMLRAWDYKADITTHTIETHLYRLRQKFAAALDIEHDLVKNALIETVRGGFLMRVA